MINLLNNNYNFQNNLGLKNLPQEKYKRPLMSIFPKEHDLRQRGNPEVLKNKKIDPIDYEPLFCTNIEKHIIQTEKREESDRMKATIMKGLFIGLLVLGIVCAASFFLLPILGNIAAALGLSVSATTMIWQGIFVAGGLLAGLSFLPKRFVRGFNEGENKNHQKAETLKQLFWEQDFRNFLEKELKDKYRNPERIVESSDFAELYYLLYSLNEKQQDINRIENELQQARELIKPRENLLGEEKKKQIEMEQKIAEVYKNLKKMKREVHEMENEINDLRSNLADLDRKKK